MKPEQAQIAGMSAAALLTLFNLIPQLQKQITPKQYATNTYLYVILAILLCVISILVMQLYDVQYDNSIVIALFIITIVIIIGLNYIKNTVARHLLWLLYIIATAYIMLPIYRATRETHTLSKVIGTVVVLTIGLVWYASTVGVNSFDSWGNYLIFGLLGLIVFEVIDLMFGKTQRFKMYSWIAIVLFSGFLMYDIKKVEQRGTIIAELCRVDADKCAEYLNYPNESLNLYLDAINLLASVAGVSRG